MRTRALLFVIVPMAVASAALAQRHAPAHPPATTPAHAATTTTPSHGTATTTTPPAHAATTATNAADAGATADASAATAATTQPTNFDIPMVQRGTGVVSHYPIPEQLARNDVPVFVQVQSSAPIDHVSLFYRTQGSPRFTELRMNPMGQDVGLPGGYGTTIPCEDAFPPAIEYFVQAMDTSGAAIGTAGAAVSPIRLPIVRERQFSFVPSLPGQTPPRNCGSLETPIVATGTGGTSAAGSHDAGAVEDTSGTGDLGDPCTRNNDCRHGLRCGAAHHCVFNQGQ